MWLWRSGIFAGYLLVLKRESRRFPWRAFLKWLAPLLLVLTLSLILAVIKFHFHVTWHLRILSQVMARWSL
jgi:hypothetical protein